MARTQTKSSGAQCLGASSLDTGRRTRHIAWDCSTRVRDTCCYCYLHNIQENNDGYSTLQNLLTFFTGLISKYTPFTTRKALKKNALFLELTI